MISVFADWHLNSESEKYLAIILNTHERSMTTSPESTREGHYGQRHT
jgi:hypothetical protein